MSKKETPSKKKSATNKTAQDAPPIGNDLEHIRDILFGNQVRATDTRLYELEGRQETMRHEFMAALNDQLTATESRLSAKLSDARKELSTRLKKQDDTQTIQIQETKERFATQQKVISETVEHNRENNNDHVAQLTADFEKQLFDIKKEMLDGLNRLNSDLSERLLGMQTELVQQNNDLRQELLTMTAWLDEKKATRIDLGQMLIDAGKQLQSKTQK